MSSLANCIHCGRLMVKKYSKICGHCRKELEPDMRKVKDFLLLHPNSTLLDVSRQTGVPVATLLHFIEDQIIYVRENEGNPYGK